MGDGRSIGGIVLTILIVCGVVGYKFYGKNEAGSHAHDAVQVRIMQVEGYDQNKDYIDHIFEAAHEAAFDDAYKMGGRRRASTFDDDKYLDLVYEHMIRQARADGSTHIAEAIEKLRGRG